jgi:DNA-binding LytR/AlgR family response regulator
MFLDIHLPKISGLDFLKSIAQPPQVILTTAFPDYALESYEFSVVDYLLKPFSFQRFVKAVAKVSDNKTQQAPTPTYSTSSLPERKSLFIKSGYEWVKIELEEIIYIKSDADYTEIKVEEKKYLSTEPLRYWEETLDQSQFIRVHKSYIINLAKIEKVAANQVYLNATAIPIGRAYKDDFLQRILL